VILRIDHVGLVTDDPAAVGASLAELGLRPAGGGTADGYGVACEFWRHDGPPGAPAVEVVSPLTDGSAVTGHLARKGPGLYHLAFEVDDLVAELARLRAAGFVAVDRQPCAGALPGMRVAFLYLARPADLLVDLVQYAAAE